MNPFVIAKSAKNALSILEINFNRLSGRELVPLQTTVLNVETSSLCNLKCVFCAYTKKHSPKVSMTDEFFKNVIWQAAAMGFTHYELTPCTGDVFMDRNVYNKFDFLEENQEVEGYHFFTNFTIPKPAQIEQIARLKKLKNVTVSIYGHDEQSFIAITKSTAKVYKRLLNNLETLYQQLDSIGFNLDIGIRTTRDEPRKAQSDIMLLLKKFEARGIKVRRAHVYNNWGGFITQEDVKGLAIDVTDARAVYKMGACSHLFTTYQVMATGIVNGCACRDVDATLRIGDLNDKPLREVLSPDNPAYMQLIGEQQQGQFREVCKSCDYYKSIYHTRMIHRKEGRQYQSIDEFKARLRAAGQPVTDDLIKKLGDPVATPQPAEPQKTKVDGPTLVP
jgi:MoaA/NifB/PqqE/SkfB family radical SAM enzyme